ncbi:hypothetical protein B0A54_18099 [Friedmanniomyces endolithicus]|uniref:Response regulatory domain-containing protein n=1 Tax=Friedmanniomyces endolithicus TaxID=329885 RepID=A0A4U0TJA2_9PEZI|nr:hypothetical protein B0A54_18099 [Friedmanniomyces endolithicus]
MSLKYGLTVKGPKAPPAPSRPTLDEEDDDDEEQAAPTSHGPPRKAPQGKPPPRLRETDAPAPETDLSSTSASQARLRTAQEVDPSIFDYDSFHAAKSTVTSAKKAAARQEALDRKPKYINNLLEAAARRKQDQLLFLLKALMKKLHIPFDTAINGPEALAMYTSTPSRYFIILTDISMPIMDGNQATAKIRELERKQKLVRTTIVAITGVTSAASRKISFDSGVDTYLTKPVKMKEVRALIAEVKERGT